MSSALPAATRPALVDERDRPHEVAAREQVRGGSAKLARSDDGYPLHRCDIVMAEAISQRVAWVRFGPPLW